MENLFYQLVTKLKERGHISYANLFVDGTKIEANANRYSFVWEKTVTKNEAKMDVQIQMKLLELQTEYDEETDSFICPNGNTLTAIGTAHRKSKSGFLSEVTLYRCTECRNCPLKAECTKSKNGRTIQRSKVLQRQREQSRERITSELGIQLRVNRSIQSEGTFGVLKQAWGFRRFLRRGQKNVYTEILIYAFAFNIQKLYAKDTNQRHGVILHQLKNAS